MFKLSLFQHLSLFLDFSMNGELSEKGFQLIAVHYKTAKLFVRPTESVYSDGPNSVKLIWGQLAVNRLKVGR